MWDICVAAVMHKLENALGVRYNEVNKSEFAEVIARYDRT